MEPFGFFFGTGGSTRGHGSSSRQRRSGSGAGEAEASAEEPLRRQFGRLLPQMRGTSDEFQEFKTTWCSSL